MLRSEISIKRITHGEVSVLHLSGDLSKQEALQLQNYIDKMVDEACFKIVLDLEHIRFIDSYAMMILLKLNRECISGGGQIKLLRPQSVVKRFMTINQVFELFECYETKIDAISSFQQTEKNNIKPVNLIQSAEKSQRILIQKLIELLVQKGYFDNEDYKSEFQNSAQLIFDIYRKELNS